MKPLILTLVLLFNIHLSAGTGVGNGGISIVCRDSNQVITKVELLDIYEGEVRHGRQYDRSEIKTTERVEKAFKLLLKYPRFYSKVKVEYDKLEKMTIFIPQGNALESTDDAFPAVRIKGCEYEQLANYTNDDQLLILSELYEKLDSLNVSALLLHEAVYAVLRKEGDQDSQMTRKFIAYLLSNNLTDSELGSFDLLRKYIENAQVLIKDPKYPNNQLALRFDDWNQENGICRLHGYEKASIQSSKFIQFSGASLVVDASGTVIQVKRKSPVVSEIICLNNLASYKTPAKIEIVNNPLHPTSQIPLRFNSWTKESGICELLGFKISIPRSSVFGLDLATAIEVDGQGQTERIRSQVPYITQIMCI